MIVGVVLLFLAIAIVGPAVFFTLVKFVGKFFSLPVDRNSWLGKKL